MMKPLFYFTILVATLMSTFIYAQNNRIASRGLAVLQEKENFSTYEFTRHAVGNNDVQIDILYAGICHSDLHEVRAEWRQGSKYPMVPGHEIAGRVVKVGKNVTKFKVGDFAGIGCMVGSCRVCEKCKNGYQQYCENGMVPTYNGTDPYNSNELTQGGYANNYVVAEDFAIKIPANAQIEKVAPLLCAGITTYSPIRYAGVKKGDKVAIAGFGGLGHMGVKYAIAIGADVTIFDITEEKRTDAARMKATRYINVNNPKELQGLNNSFDFILSTIPTNYDMNMYLKMLRYDGHLAIVGLPAFANMPSLRLDQFIWQGGRRVFGSLIGGIQETQEMIDYSIANNIYPEVEIIPADGEAIDRAYQNILDGKVKFRYVIDMKTLK